MESKIIKQLSKILSLNHLLSSIDLETLNREDIWGSILNKDINDNIKKRTIVVVVGAGASSYGNMPLGKDAIEILKNKFRINPEAFQYTLDELESVYRFDRTTFETNLLAFSKFRPNSLLDELNRMYSHRYFPIFCYEMLAHLLKHRFIDVIINFNFDEFLDQSIDDEVGIDEYYKIIFDGDCPEHFLSKDSSDDYEEKPDLPVYIKPHGTASHKSTLRFTREDYFRLPKDIRILLDNLLIKPNLPLILICIGFNMQSFEFNHMIKNLPRGSEIYYINKSKPEPEPKLHIDKTYHIKVNDKNDLNSIIKNLWDEISELFKQNYKPRSIDRHLILSSMFKDYNTDTPRKKPLKRKYFLNRTKIELLISAAKSKGLINMSEVARGRCGKYYDLYQKEAMHTSRRAKSFANIFQEFNFVEAEYGFELFRLKTEMKEDSKFDMNKLIMRKKEFDRWVKKIGPLLQNIFDEQNPKIQRDKDLSKNIGDYFRNLYNPEDTEIRICKNTIYNKIFISPTFLKTKTSLKLSTDMLLRTDWDQIFIVAETGQWLLQENISDFIHKRSINCQKPIRIILIVADSSYEKQLVEHYSFCKFKLFQLNWWEHNRHFTIFLRSKEPISCIYFSRRLRSQHITPILLNQEDSLKALSVFCVYHQKTLNNESRIIDNLLVKQPRLYIDKYFDDDIDEEGDD